MPTFTLLAGGLDQASFRGRFRFEHPSRITGRRPRGTLPFLILLAVHAVSTKIRKLYGPSVVLLFSWLTSIGTGVIVWRKVSLGQQ
jgi:hypothetical protein